MDSTACTLPPLVPSGSVSPGLQGGRNILIPELQEEYTYTGITGGIYPYRNYRRNILVQELHQHLPARLSWGKETLSIVSACCHK